MVVWCAWTWYVLVAVAGTFIMAIVLHPAVAHAPWFLGVQVAWGSGVLLYLTTAAMHYFSALRVADFVYNWQLTIRLMAAVSPLCLAANVLDEVSRQG